MKRGEGEEGEEGEEGVIACGEEVARDPIPRDPHPGLSTSLAVERCQSLAKHLSLAHLGGSEGLRVREGKR